MRVPTGLAFEEVSTEAILKLLVIVFCVPIVLPSVSTLDAVALEAPIKTLLPPMTANDSRVVGATAALVIGTISLPLPLTVRMIAVPASELVTVVISNPPADAISMTLVSPVGAIALAADNSFAAPSTTIEVAPMGSEMTAPFTVTGTPPAVIRCEPMSKTLGNDPVVVETAVGAVLVVAGS